MRPTILGGAFLFAPTKLVSGDMTTNKNKFGVDFLQPPLRAPRAYQLPYTDKLARKVSHAQEIRDRGVDVMGHVYDRPAETAKPRSDIKMGRMESAQEGAYVDAVPFREDGSRLGFEELPPVVLPDKGPL
jgi:hypothetical protein